MWIACWSPLYPFLKGIKSRWIRSHGLVPCGIGRLEICRGISDKWQASHKGSSSSVFLLPVMMTPSAASGRC